MAAFRVLETHFQKFIKPQFSSDGEDGIMIRKYFLAYTRIKVQQFRDTLIKHMESFKKSIDERTLHKREYEGGKFIKPQFSSDGEDGIMIRKYFLAYTRIKVQQFRDTLIKHMESFKKSIDERTLHKREYEGGVRQMQTIEGKNDTSNELDASLVDT
nr:hypothetical protein [Tanacetum cinerariifolium]